MTYTADSTTTGQVWSYWTDNGTGTATTGQLWGDYSSDTAWNGWTRATCNSATGTIYVDPSTTITVSNCWFYWNEQTGVMTVENRDTEELRQQRERNEQAAREQAAARDAAKAAADEKALELLQDLITDDEFAVYQETGRLLVRGRKHDYLVQRDSGRVVRCEKGKVADLCMHLEDYHTYSKHDNVIAMKLFLEGREDQFNQEANLCGRRDPNSVEAELLQAVNG